MCGRFALTASSEEIAELFEVSPPVEFPPRYNIAPAQPILVVSPGATDQRQTSLVRWGLVPHWVKNPDDFGLLHNARAETAAWKASFKTAMRHRRVLVPASGFYEWHRPAAKNLPKQAYWVRPRETGLVAFGGLVETWMGADGSEIDTGCILTTGSNTQLGTIHHRMPVVIKPQDFERWLDCKSQEPRHVADLMQPVEDEVFEIIAVSENVNRVANGGPDIQKQVEITPIPHSQAKPPDQMDMF